MKNQLFTILILCFSYHLGAQPQLIRQDTFQLPFKIGYVNNQLQIQKNLNQWAHQEKYPQKLMEINQLSLEDGDLLLDYKLVGPDKLFYYDVKFHLIDKNERYIPISLYQIRGDFGEVSPPEQPALRVQWMDVGESYLYYNQSYKLKAEIDLYSQKIANCERPKFGFEKWLPHIGGGIASGVLFLISNNIRKQAKDIYDGDYIEAWVGDAANGKPPQNAETGAEIYTRFTDRRSNHHRYYWTGWGTIGLNTAWLVIRLNNHKNKVKLYKRYCGKS